MQRNCIVLCCAQIIFIPSGQLCESAAVRQPLQIRCFSARTEVLAWETGERRREDGGGQDEAPFGTAKFPLSFSSSDFFWGHETAILLWSSCSEILSPLLPAKKIMPEKIISPSSKPLLICFSNSSNSFMFFSCSLILQSTQGAKLKAMAPVTTHSLAKTETAVRMKCVLPEW